MSKERPVPHQFEGESLESVFVGRRDGQSRPTVILIPTVMGVSDLEKRFGRQLVELGYNALVTDLFGKEFHGAARDTMFEQMTRLRGDRAALRRRLQHVLELVRTLEEVQNEQIVVAGYCFGGQCALDLARSGADVAAAVSFHGLFDPPGIAPQKIKAKVVAYHGWDDPMVPPEKVVALGRELTEAGCDWQIHAYGHVGHGFTNPHASELKIEGVAYNALAAERSWTSFINLLEELFGGNDH
ncbi:MAG TPA: dienelactone hydrolase family protein [Sphingomicrobium sp.]|jgi:dienelactone hydrolase|nr:dienelactone hydrolase family protein [Sphingomicrobium sp.]